MRFLSTLARKQLTVPPFCTVHVNLPCRVKVTPLDLNRHPNNDKVTVQPQNQVKCTLNGDKVEISADATDIDFKTLCEVEIPLKASVIARAAGDIVTGHCSGSNLTLISDSGKISVEKFEGDALNLTTNKGDITLKGTTLASTMTIQVLKQGSIATKRLQALNANITSQMGNITVESSYCDKSLFQTNQGNLNLDNIHKSAEIRLDGGHLRLNGADGDVNIELHRATADIQLSRVSNNSKIILKDHGLLTLRLSEECQEGVMFEITAAKHTISPQIVMKRSQNTNTLYLIPTTTDYRRVFVEAGAVNIQAASWISTLKLAK